MLGRGVGVTVALAVELVALGVAVDPFPGVTGWQADTTSASSTKGQVQRVRLDFIDLIIRR
jgi:hypothetical protein